MVSTRLSRRLADNRDRYGTTEHVIEADGFSFNRKELAEIQNPVARHLFILAKAPRLVHLQIAEYVALVAAADMTGHYGVGVLLESSLADKLAFAERTRRFIRNLVQQKIAAKLAA